MNLSFPSVPRSLFFFPVPSPSFFSLFHPSGALFSGPPSTGVGIKVIVLEDVLVTAAFMKVASRFLLPFFPIPLPFPLPPRYLVRGTKNYEEIMGRFGRDGCMRWWLWTQKCLFPRFLFSPHHPAGGWRKKKSVDVERKQRHTKGFHLDTPLLLFFVPPFFWKSTLNTSPNRAVGNVSRRRRRSRTPHRPRS